MKTIAYIYILTTFGLVPYVNYERTELPTESTTKEVLFWCDCGAKYDWRTKPLTKLN